MSLYEIYEGMGYPLFSILGSRARIQGVWFHLSIVSLPDPHGRISVQESPAPNVKPPRPPILDTPNIWYITIYWEYLLWVGGFNIGGED